MVIHRPMGLGCMAIMATTVTMEAIMDIMAVCMATILLLGQDGHRFQVFVLLVFYHWEFCLGSMPFQYDAPKTPFWQRLLEGLQKIVNCFGRVTFLVDENTQAFHFFITALLTFLDKAGSLYGEIARFVMKLLGLRRRSKSSVPEVSRVASGRTNNPSELFKKIWKE